MQETRINKELPNGLQWHMERFRKTIQSGGKAFGCFHGNTLVGYATVNADMFGIYSKYVLLDQIFISKIIVIKELAGNCLIYVTFRQGLLEQINCIYVLVHLKAQLHFIKSLDA